jgi:hypothetical protein
MFLFTKGRKVTKGRKAERGFVYPKSLCASLGHARHATGDRASAESTRRIVAVWWAGPIQLIVLSRIGQRFYPGVGIGSVSVILYCARSSSVKSRGSIDSVEALGGRRALIEM